MGAWSQLAMGTSAQSASRPRGWNAASSFNFNPILDPGTNDPGLPPGWGLNPEPTPGSRPPTEPVPAAVAGPTRLEIWQAWLNRVKSMLARQPTENPDFQGPEPNIFTRDDLSGTPPAPEPGLLTPWPWPSQPAEPVGTGLPTHLPPPWGPGPTRKPKLPTFTFSGLSL